jgi:hypothetical protein
MQKSELQLQELKGQGPHSPKSIQLSMTLKKIILTLVFVSHHAWALDLSVICHGEEVATAVRRDGTNGEKKTKKSIRLEITSGKWGDVPCQTVTDAHIGCYHTSLAEDGKTLLRTLELHRNTGKAEVLGVKTYPIDQKLQEMRLLFRGTCE